MSQIRVLFLYPNEFFGPEMTIFTQVIRHLDRSRFTPYVAVNDEATGTLQLNEANGIRISHWQFGMAFRGSWSGGLRSLLQLPGTLLALAQYARREGIEIVHCTSTPRSATLGLIIARLSGARLLVHYHVLAGRYAGPRRIFENLVARHSDRAVAVSRFLATQIPSTGLSPDKIDVVVNGTDLGTFRPEVDGSRIRAEYGISSGEVLVLQLARVIQQKRQEDVVRAFAIARRSVPNLRCLIVGWEDPRYSGQFASYMAELHHICEQEHLGDSLIFAAARPEAAKLAAAADIVVMPAEGDAWNLAVTEAMAAGKPVIGASSGGIPEQVVDGKTGFLVPLRAPDVLAEKMVLLGRDAVLRRRMGQAGRQRAETYFGEERVAEGFAPIYEALVHHTHKADLQQSGCAY